MANPIEYIVFEPDQVLTNDHLNETFNYLDQQNRWTRNKLIGIGIVCGFDIVLNPGVIQINKGTGITSQGYLINQCTTQYTYYIPYSPVDMPQDLPFTYTGNLPFYKPFCQNLTVYQLLSDDQYNALESAQQSAAVTISSSASTLANYAVVLFLEAAETELKNCNMLDCNNNGSTMVFTLRPLLVATNNLPGTSTIRISIPLLQRLNLSFTNQVSLKRYNVPYAALNNASDVINGFVNLVDDATLTQVANAYTACYNQYGSLVGATANPFTNLLANLQSARSSIQSQNPVFIQYLYDFVDDLIKAYQEFTAKASDIVGTCCPDESLFPLHLVLGSASQATSSYSTDPYRTYFTYSALFNKMGSNDVADAALLFNRMVIMVNYFTVQSTALQLQAAITITPSNYEFPPLSERAIPYYYKPNVSGSELYKYWNYYKTTQGQATSNLSYNASLYSSDAAVTTPLLYDIESFNFFRVEGHIGQNYNTVLTNIIGQQSKYNLPFDVVAISADLLQSTAALPQCNMNDLDADYQLIVSEAACKIHTVFCFVTKLPYVVAAPAATAPTTATNFTTTRDFLYEIPKTTTLNYTAFKLAPATIDILALKSTAYKKGDFMQKYCTPVANTVGSAYISALSSTGVFTNPVQIDSSNSLTTVYYYLFAFVDAVEELMYVLNTNTLAELDITNFNTVYQTYLTETLAALGILMDLTEQIASSTNTGANAQYVTLAEDTELDLLVEELGLLTNMCLEERLQVLNNTYTTRLTNYQQQLTFLNYYKNHTGLEHKAGVPKGGTFVLVYHTATTTTPTNANTADTAATANTANTFAATDVSTSALADKRMLVTDRVNTDVLATEANTTDAVAASTTTAAETPVLSTSTLSYIGSYINDSSAFTAAERQNILNILGRIPVRKPTGYTLTDGAVIADFYIPYLCCSDCPPVAYVLTNTTTTTPPPVKPVITMGTTFCDNDTTAEPITVSAPGGTFNTVAGLDPTKLTFTPATAKAGTFTITYTLNGVVSDPVTVVVLATPVSTFTFTSKVSASDSDITTITADFTPDQVNSAYTYQWSFGAGFSATTSAVQSPELTAHVSPTVGPIATTATLTVSNGKCAQAAVTKKLFITAGGLTETAPVKPTITMGTSFCDNDTTAEAIKVSAAGGTFNTVPGLDPTKLTFTPATAKAGTFTIVYTLDGIASDPVTVTVLATPVSTFTFTSKVNNINGATIVTADFAPDQKNTAYTYKWSFGTGFSTATSAVESPELTATVNPTGIETKTFATLTVSNGKCAQAAVTKTLYITGNGLSENPPGTPPSNPTIPKIPTPVTGPVKIPVETPQTPPVAKLDTTAETAPIAKEAAAPAPVTKPVTTTEAAPVAKAETAPVAAQEAAPIAKPVTTAEAAPTIKPVTEPVATTVAKSETTATTAQPIKAEAAPATQAEAAPTIKPVAEPVAKSETTAQPIKAEAAPSIQAEATPTIKPVAEPVATTVAKPETTATTAQPIKAEAAPATQAEAAPAIKPVAEPITSTVAKPETTPAATVETGQVVKPEANPVAATVAAQTAKPATAVPATAATATNVAKPEATPVAATEAAKPAATASAAPTAKPVTSAETAAAKPATSVTAPTAKPAAQVETEAAKPATIATAAKPVTPAATEAVKPATKAAAPTAKPVTPAEADAVKPATAPTAKPATPAATEAAKPTVTQAAEPAAKPAAEPETPPSTGSTGIVSGIKNLFTKKS
ncbi:hypothetical protein HDF24_23075 [Mucilaginibacter sp. X4EP1]|uniref:hypothetical protein n=1 Tax=Mucilaginibacter sp. X4EP1 TaxID=2723092 RepID=UPI00286EB184|nr:hypothetical protein [Mucilaginibacter sp. X4EP1]MCS3816017.1 hypothetical protein [Mucilaginibacter sp. X4EP1]